MFFRAFPAENTFVWRRYQHAPSHTLYLTKNHSVYFKPIMPNIKQNRLHVKYVDVPLTTMNSNDTVSMTYFCLAKVQSLSRTIFSATLKQTICTLTNSDNYRLRNDHSNRLRVLQTLLLFGYHFCCRHCYCCCSLVMRCTAFECRENKQMKY